MKYQILFNPLTNNNCGEAEAHKLDEILSGEELSYIDLTRLESYDAFFAQVPAEETVILCGGDGTINRFINSADVDAIKCSLLYFPGGTGNDFLRDVEKDEKGLVQLTRYVKGLPTVEVKGKTYRFINGIGYGIDGYCCEVGDIQREKNPGKKINYTGIAIKGLLFHFKPVNAEVTVDGVTKSYKKVWLVPTMHGKYYGGGMIPTPAQDRLNEEGTVSTMVYYGIGKLKALMVFPSIFKGEHVKHTEMIEIFTGKDVVVKFDTPTALQVDGETILGVTEYHVKSGK